MHELQFQMEHIVNRHQRDLMENLAIKTPLPVRDIGTVFWSVSYFSGKPEYQYADFEMFVKQPWTVHYSVPRYGGLRVDIKLNKPLRCRGDGYESVIIDIDYLMCTIDREFVRDWDQRAKIHELSIPRRVIERLESLLRQWQGERLHIYYDCLEDDSDIWTIWAEFSGCRRLTTNPDHTLLHIQEVLNRQLLLP